MSEAQCYCFHCGAANVAESETCFACHYPLDTPQEDQQSVSLNGRYRLLTQVGVGGFGGVYRAEDTVEVSRIVAVKQITLRGLSAQEAIEATEGFQREVRLLSALRHPQVPAIHDAFTDSDHWYLVMDFIEGETLEAYLKRSPGGKLPLDEALSLGVQLCSVLGYLHTREPAIIFRDLKPSNVMRAPQGRLSLIDFGIARHFTPGKLKDTVPFGSPGYAAPEQYGRMQTTPRADIYGLGALLHQMLTGDDPADSPFRFAPLPSADSTTLEELDTLLRRMVATDPSNRPATIDEVQAILQRLAEQERQKRRAHIGLLGAPGPVQSPLQALTPHAHLTRRGVLTRALKLGAIAAVAGGIIAVSGVAVFNSLNSHPTGPFGISAPTPPNPGVAKKQFVYRGHKGSITALSWSPDGTMVTSGSADKTVQVWRAADGVLLYTLSGYDRPVTSVVWATDAKDVIASSGMSDGTVQVWDALKDHRYFIYHGDGRVLALSWRWNSPWVVSGGTDRGVYIWNALTGAKGANYTGHRGDVRAVCWISGLSLQDFSTPGTTTGSLPEQVVASGGADRTVQIWNASNGKPISTYTKHSAGVNGLALLQDGPTGPVEFIASASDDETVHVWSPGSRETLTIYEHRGKKLHVPANRMPHASLPRIVLAPTDAVRIRVPLPPASV